MNEDKPKKSVKGKIILSLLVFTGIYLAFLPNRLSTSSILDFAKGEPEVPADNFDLEGFSRIPVLRGGRVKPIDSVARNSLLVLRNKRTALDEAGNKIPAINWFAEVMFNPETGDNLKTFLVDHDQVLGLLGKKFSVDGNFSPIRILSHISMRSIPLPAKRVISNRKKGTASIRTLSNFTDRFCSIVK
jgi:hypothetical protein